jgi:hypothetical protein
VNSAKQLKKLKIINSPEKPIITSGPHDEYQMDLWYLPKEIREKVAYKNIMDIIDHFSKWMWSYPLKEKTAFEAVKCIKSFVYSFGKCNKLHTYNGLEVKNNLMDEFCAQYNIRHIYSKPYSPKSNGAVEASHKQIKNLLFDRYYTSKIDEFDIDDAILSAINYHNNSVHTTTKFKPVYLRDITDLKIINEVKANITKSILTAIK